MPCCQRYITGMRVLCGAAAGRKVCFWACQVLALPTPPIKRQNGAYTFIHAICLVLRYRRPRRPRDRIVYHPVFGDICIHRCHRRACTALCNKSTAGVAEGIYGYCSVRRAVQYTKQERKPLRCRSDAISRSGSCSCRCRCRSRGGAMSCIRT